ncbi:MAG: 3-phosphoshikimate 1-carboxyvinyltransferase [Clostridia bacterium]|nr:3-phosphoshikimate 1-carboxyvinyltransferase [Clostridia bacterium]
MKIHSKENLYGEYTVPSDKSITSRAIMLGGIAKGKTYVIDPLMCADVLTMISCVKKLGAKVKLKGRILEIKSAKKLKSGLKFDCGNSGTTLRFLCGVASGGNISAILTGDKALQKRQMRELQEPLQKMGATVSLQRGGVPPIYVHGATLRPIDYPLHTASSQIKSSILLCALVSGVRATIKEELATRNHMEILMKYMGADIEKDETSGTITLEKSELKARKIFVCGDFSIAMNFVALGLLCGKTVCKNVGVNPTRTHVLTILKRMGAKFEIKNRRILCGEPVADIVAYKSNLTATHVTGEEVLKITDDLPILSVLMGVAEGESIISDLGFQYKDLDRRDVIMNMINSVGGNCRKFSSGLAIKGVERYEGGNLESFGDARVAMSASIALSSSVNGGETDDDALVNAEFPGFYESLRKNSFVRISACPPSDDSNKIHAFILSKLKVKNFTFSYLNVADGGIRKSFAEAKDFDGISVHAPYNVETFKRITKLDKRAKAVKSVNTVKLMEGFSTEGDGVIYALKNRGVELAGKKVLVLGCGRVAKNVIFSLLEEKALVTVYNRTPKTANELKKKYSQISIKNEFNDSGLFDVVINATPLGGGYLAGVLPIDKETITSSSLIVDMVIRPKYTQLIKTAIAYGTDVVFGEEVSFFVNYLSDCIFVESEPSVEQAISFYKDYLVGDQND